MFGYAFPVTEVCQQEEAEAGAVRRHTLHKLRNVLHSAILIIGMAVIAALCALTLWGAEGVLWAFFGVVLAMLLSPSIPTRLVLSLYQAQPLGRSQFPEGYAILDALSERAGLPATPKLYYVPSALMNAFALGNRHQSALAVTDGMLRALTPRELTAVLAHEISHIANNDLWIMNLADTMSRATALLSYLGIFLLLLNLPLVVAGIVGVPWLLVLVLVSAPTLMSLMQLALSRSREFDADLDAAALTGDASGLMSALAKLEHFQGRFWERLVFPGRRIPDPSLLRTHPPTEERLRRLQHLQPSERRPAERWEAGRLSALAGFPPIRVSPRRRWLDLWY